MPMTPHILGWMCLIILLWVGGIALAIRYVYNFGTWMLVWLWTVIAALVAGFIWGLVL